MENINQINNKGVISAATTHTKRAITTRTHYYLLGSDYSQQE